MPQYETEISKKVNSVLRKGRFEVNIQDPNLENDTSGLCTSAP